jgi:hypothetical protein
MVPNYGIVVKGEVLLCKRSIKTTFYQQDSPLFPVAKAMEMI